MAAANEGGSTYEDGGKGSGIMRRVWLWDAGRHCGVTDDEDRALAAARACLHNGNAARVELARVIPSITDLTWKYIRTGTGWTGRCVNGCFAWLPLYATPEQQSHSKTEEAIMEDGLFAFERVHLEKLRLACQVLLGLAEEQFISDPFETELHELQDRIERVLLLPDRSGAPA
jgi:hypothetical protein